MDRLGDVALRALAVVVLAAVPAALRTSVAGGGFGEALLVASGVLLPVVAFALLLSRAAGRGFRQLVGAAPPRPAVLGVALWVALATPFLVVLGAGLKATTHHRGLGGATYGVFALVVAAAAALVAERLVTLAQAAVARGVKPWIPALIGAAVGGLPLLAVAVPLGSRSDDPAGPAVRAAILDGAIVVVATALAAVTRIPDAARKAARLAAVPMAAVLCVAGFARIESSPALAKAMRAGGGLASTILSALEHWSDRDEDGVGAHFGGDDCDEGDPTRHPGALEIPGDGVDQDCDGIDPPRPAKSAAVASGSAGSGSPAAPPSAGAAGRPDVIFVTLDSVRADHTSTFGYDKPTTPHLDELADRGVRFVHAYAAGGDPQRALSPLVTGKYLADVRRDKREWPTILPGNDTLAERLKRAGYRTAGVTSFTWLSQERGFAQGFDYWRPVFDGVHPEREVTGHLALKAAVSLWKELAADPHPIFLWVHLFDAHERYLEHPGIHIKSKTPAYDGEVAYVDKILGDLMAAVAATPRAAQVAWVVHGSQGEGFDEHDFQGHSGEVYDEALHVPLVVALPGAKPGRYEAAAVSVLDLPATIADLAGAAAEGLAGVSLAPVARGDLARPHRPVYARSQRRAALIDWPLKLILIERKKIDRTLLFDLSADPAEKEDLSATRAADVERLQKERAAIEGAPNR
jgi:arylsulfatase A-like enzyme